MTKILNVSEGIHSFQNSLITAQMFKYHYTGSPFFIPKHFSSVTRVLNKNSNLEPKEMSHLEPLGFQLPLVLVFKYHNGSVS